MAIAAGLLPFWIHTHGEGGGTLNLVSPLRFEGFANVSALELYKAVTNDISVTQTENPKVRHVK